MSTGHSTCHHRTSQIDEHLIKQTSNPETADSLDGTEPQVAKLVDMEEKGSAVEGWARVVAVVVERGLEEVEAAMVRAMVAAAMAAASSMRRLHPPDVSQSEPRPSR